MRSVHYQRNSPLCFECPPSYEAQQTNLTSQVRRRVCSGARAARRVLAHPETGPGREVTGHAPVGAGAVRLLPDDDCAI